jgi:hypothetical protein
MLLKRLYRSLPRPVRASLESGFERAVSKFPPRQRIMLTYYKSFGRFPNLRSPKLYSERMQARKLSGEDLSRYVDKIRVKDFVKERCGDIIIPTLYAGDCLPPRSERNWPLPFVIKTSHASGTNIFVRRAPDWDAIEPKLEEFLAHRHGEVTGELFYRNVPPRVLVEPIIGNGIDAPVDYRLHVAGGEVQFILLDQDPVDHRRVFYSPSWDRLAIRDGRPVGVDAERPQCLEQMVAIAEKLGRGLGFVRVDLYEVEARVYFGELTFAPSAGYMRFDPPEWDVILGEKWAKTEKVPA